MRDTRYHTGCETLLRNFMSKNQNLTDEAGAISWTLEAVRNGSVKSPYQADNRLRYLTEDRQE